MTWPMKEPLFIEVVPALSEGRWLITRRATTKG